MAKKAQSSEQNQSKEKRNRRLFEEGIAHSINHPVRLDTLSILFERISSPKEIAGVLQAPLATVSFHITELVADGAIELVRTEPRRGAVEHFYRAKVRPEVTEKEWRAMPKGARRKLAATLLQAVVAEGLASLRHGKMEIDDDLYIVWIPMKVSEKGQKEVAEVQAEMLERIQAIKEADESRLEGDEDANGAATERVAAFMWFERAQAGTRPKKKPAKKSSKG